MRAKLFVSERAINAPAWFLRVRDERDRFLFDVDVYTNGWHIVRYYYSNTDCYKELP